MTDRKSLHDLSALDDREVLMVIADRQLDQAEDIAAIRNTLHGPDGRGGIVGDIAGLMAWRNRSIPPNGRGGPPPPNGHAVVQVARWQAIAIIVAALVGLASTYLLGRSGLPTTQPVMAEPLHQSR